MKNQLCKFNTLCESIETNISSNLYTEKTHGMLHNLRPFARKKRYIEEDFLDLWNDSCLDKFKFALDGAKLNFKFDEIKVGNGERDIYTGTDRPGVFLKYKVDPSNERYLIDEILKRLKANSSNDDLAPWRAFIENEKALADKEKHEFHLPMEIQVIARIKANQNQNFQNKKDIEITQFNEAGFDGNIYLWFDLSKYKNELKASIDAHKNETFDEYKRANGVVSEEAEDTSDQQDIDIHLTNIEQDKILLGTFDIAVSNSDKKGVLGITTNLLSGQFDNMISDFLTTGFNRLRGMGNRKDNSEKPDIIRKKVGLFGTEKPYVEVLSKVTLQKWLYNIEEMPERKYLGQDGKKINVTSLTKFQFERSNLRTNNNPLAADLDWNSNPCWSVGNLVGAERWERKPITIEWLQNTEIEHLVTLKFQSWVKRDARYYFEYRFVFNLGGFYKLRQEVDFMKKRIEDMEKEGKDESAKDKYAKRVNEYKQLVKQLGNFKEWFDRYIDEMQKYRPDEFSRASVDKILYNTNDEMVNRDAHIQNSFQSFKQRDVTGFYFLLEVLEKNWKCQGQYLNDILKDI